MLPEEEEEEIMSRLRPDSLIRFKLVSKSWHAVIKCLIQDPKLVAKNLRNMNKASSSTSLAFIRLFQCTCKEPKRMEHLPHRFSFESPHSPSCPAHGGPYLLTLIHKDGDLENNDDNFRCVTDYFHLPRLLDDIGF